MNKLKTLITGARLWLCDFGLKYREPLSILVGLLILLVFPGIIRGVDPTAAPIDPGVISAIILACITVMIFKSLTWWLIKSIWPLFANYSETNFADDFQNLTPWQRTSTYLLFYLSLVALLVVTAKTFL